MTQTSEWVSPGHPDRIADYISSALLDAYIERDPSVRYAVECQVKDNFVSLAGEVTSTVDFSLEEIRRVVQSAVAGIGYTRDYARRWGADNALDADNLVVTTRISRQSPDIAQGVDADGWGDQGIFFGMATGESAFDFLPRDCWYARAIGNALYRRALKGDDAGIGLDIKTQVETEDGRPSSVIVAVPLIDERTADYIEGRMRSIVGDGVPIIVNGTGRYVRHSSMGDCGTTGRKLAVDFYGGNCRIGGGSPWTKDPTKADLALNLYARRIALDYILTHPDAPLVRVAVSCCIGRREIKIALFDDSNRQLETRFESRPASEIIDELRLRRPIYRHLCEHGLFAETDRLFAAVVRPFWERF